MEGTLPISETAAQQPLENNTNPSTTTPPVVNVDAEAIRKELEQERMRKNQLENELKKFKEAQDAAKAKELEEKEEYKTLYEEQKAENERIRLEKESAERQSTLNEEKNALLAEFPQAVREIAETTGLSLADDSDEAKEALKAKLTEISERVGSDARVTPNNTRHVSNDKSRDELLKEYRETGDPNVMSAAINNLSFVKPFTGQK